MIASQDTLLVVLLCLFTLVISIRIDTRDLNGQLLECYDYIIAGGGVSGLVVANRLTEDPNGGDQNEDTILYPIDAGYGLGTQYDWNLWTGPQTSLNDEPRPYDLGRGIGGGSLINGMCWTRGGRADYDAWVTLGNPGWGWDDLLPYFKKSENYTDDVDAEFSHELYIQPDPSVHGTDGYVHVSYPRYFYNQSQVFLDGLNELGIPILTEPQNGNAAGGMLIPNNINPENQTRSTARIGYYDGFIKTRPNLHVATNQHVLRVMLDFNSTSRSRDLPTNDFWVSGIEFIPDGTLSIRNVSCSREVILAAGAVHTPQILEFSGIGDPNVLNDFNIAININLPGVGNNFQDHPYLGVVYYVTNASYLSLPMLYNNPSLLNQSAQEYYVNKTGPWTAGAINTVAFPSLQSISNNWTSMVADAISQSPSQYLVPDLDQSVIDGYKAQKNILASMLNRSDVGAYEILSDNIGLLSVAAMHTFSRGSVHIQSTDPLMQPLIDPRYCSNPLDCQIIVEGLLFNNQLLNTSSMRLLEPAPYYPFLQGATPQTLMPAIQSGVRTEFHGTGSTSMLPIGLGGVVNPRLVVYGTINLRIVDAGIVPLIPASHMQAPVYAIAEKAADIIKLDNAGLAPQSCGAAQSVSSPQISIMREVTTSSSIELPLPSPSTFLELLNVSTLVLNTSTTVGPSAWPGQLAQGMLVASPLSNATFFKPTLNVSKTVVNVIADAMSIFFAQDLLTSPSSSLPALTTSSTASTSALLPRPQSPSLDFVSRSSPTRALSWGSAQPSVNIPEISGTSLSDRLDDLWGVSAAFKDVAIDEGMSKTAEGDEKGADDI